VINKIFLLNLLRGVKVSYFYSENNRFIFKFNIIFLLGGGGGVQRKEDIAICVKLLYLHRLCAKTF